MAASFEVEYFISHSSYIADYHNFLRQHNLALADRVSAYLQSHHTMEYKQFVHSVGLFSIHLFFYSYYLLLTKYMIATVVVIFSSFLFL